jgi:hypothetical protein
MTRRVLPDMVNEYHKKISSLPNNFFVHVVSSSHWTDSPLCICSNECFTKWYLMENGQKVNLCGCCCYDDRDVDNCECCKFYHIDHQFGSICERCNNTKNGLVLSSIIRETLIMFKKDKTSATIIISTIKKFREEILRLQNDMNTEIFIEWLRCFVLYIGNHAIGISLLTSNRASLIYLTIFDALTAENLARIRESLNALTHPPINDDTLFEIYYNLFIKTESGEYVWKKE